MTPAESIEDKEKEVVSEQIPVSAFIVCKNEERHIAQCIESLNFFDEILVIDSFSTDSTPEICKAYHNVTFIQKPWLGYRAQKEFAANKVRNEWVFFLDADEILTSELREEIVDLLKPENSARLESCDGYYVCRVMFFLGKWWRKGGWYPDYVIRLFKKSKTSWLGVDPHEVVTVDGKLGKLKGEIEHFSYDNLSDQVNKLSTHAQTRARADSLGGKKASTAKMFINPVIRFFKFYILKKGFLEGFPGLIVAILEAYYTFLKYAYLWELNRKEARD